MSTSWNCRHTIAIAVSGLLSSAVFAADPPAPVEEVVVVAQKQPYRGDTDLKDLPQNIRTLDADLLYDAGVTKLNDALDLASGIARQNTLGGLWDSFAIRGFAGDENVPSGFLVNGFSEGKGFNGQRDASNVERIEILKGPASALFGRSEPGGTVNLVTKKPLFKPQGSVELSIGSFSTYRLAGDYTGPINGDVAFRVNGAYEDAKSFRDTVTSTKYTVTPSFIARLSRSTSLSYELEAVDQKAPFDRGIVAINGALGAIPNSRFLGEPGDGRNEVKALGHQVVLEHDFDVDWSLLAGLGYRTSDLKGFSTEASALQPDNRTLWRQRRSRDYSSDDTTARAELTGKFNIASFVNHVLLGTDYDEFKLDEVQNRVRPTAAAPDAIDIFNPVYGQLPDVKPFVSTLEKDDAYGVYAQDQVDLTEQWKMLVGVRFDNFRQTLTNRIAGVASEQRVNATSPRFGLVYQLARTVSLYTSYAKGFRPNTGSDFSGQAFKPETSRSVEVGAKLETPDGKISGTIAVYKMDKSNVLTADPVNAGFSITAGAAQSEGVEVDASGELAKDLRASFAYAYTDAKYTNSIFDVDFARPIPPGSQLLDIPKNSATVLLIQDFHMDDAKFSVGAGANYVGARLGETGVPSFQLPSYTIAKLIASYEPSKKLKFTFDVDNLFDKTYYPSSYQRIWVAAGASRTFTLRTLYQF